MQITRNLNNLKSINIKNNFFKNSFFSVISEWNKFALKISDSVTLESFKKQILDFIRPRDNSTSKLHNPIEIKALTSFRVTLRLLKEQKFNQDSIDPLRSCGNSIESMIHFCLHCSNYTFQGQALF